MKKKILTLYILLNILVSTYAIDSFKTVLGSGNTMENYSAEAIMDNNIATSSRFNVGEKFGWFEIILDEEKLINYVKIDAKIPENVTAYIEYECDGYIKTFVSSFMTNIFEETLIDLSEDHIVTGKLYIMFSGENLDNLIVNEIKIDSEKHSTHIEKKKLIIDTESVSSSSYTGSQHLIDGLIGTVWRTWNNENWGKSHWFVLEGIKSSLKHNKKGNAWQKSFTELLPVEADVFETLKIYVDKDAIGKLDITINNGISIDSYYLEDYKEQWIEIPIKEYGEIYQLRLDTSSDQKTYSGIGEVEIWGENNPKQKDYLDIIPYSRFEDLTENIFTIEELDYNDEYQLDIVVDNKNNQDVKTLINNKEIKYLRKLEYYGYELYRYILTDRDILIGDNFFQSHTEGSYKILNAQLIKNNTIDTIKLSQSQLSDNRSYSGVSYNDTLLSFEDGEFLVDKIKVHYNSDIPVGLYFQLENNIRIYPEIADNKAGCLEYNVDKKYRNVGFENPASATEIQVFGSITKSDNPYIKILHPTSNQILEEHESGYKVLWGITDSPDKNITINGFETQRYGNYFWVNDTKNEFKETGVHTITAELIKDNGSKVIDSLDITIQSNTHEFTIDQEDKVYYTKDDFFTLTGKTNPWNSKLYVNDIEVVTNNNRKFSTDVLLKDGLNIINIRLEHKRNGRTKEIHTRKVYKETQSNTLLITSPTDGVVTNKDKIDVTGYATSLNLEKIEVNGIIASVRNGRFKANEIPVMNEENSIYIVSTYKNGDNVTKTIVIYKDQISPKVTEVKPINDSWFPTEYVTVSGLVDDQNSFSVFVNKLKANIIGNKFSASIPVGEVENDILIEARDNSGNLTSYPLFNINIDVTPPEPFVVASNHESWTSDKRPIITFNTTDTFIGVSHYEISINGGKFIPQVSPFQMPFLSDGKNKVIVRAYDKVDNYRDSEVTLKIDTTPPDEPGNFRAVSGNGSVTLRWVEDDYETKNYVITHNDNTYTVDSIRTKNDLTNTFYEYKIEDLSNGSLEEFFIHAVDRVGNIGTRISDTAKIGITVEAVNNEVGTIVEFENALLMIKKDSLPEDIKEIVIEEVESPQLKKLASFPIISPILDFKVINSDDEEVEHIAFKEDFIGQINYDPTLLPEGYPEQNIDIYYFDSNWSSWVKVENSAVDIKQNKIFFATNHFSLYSAQPTFIEDLTPQEQSEIEFSPFSTKVTHNKLNVSPQSGAISTSMTELSLPGKNGFDFILTRTYDSTTAKSEASMLDNNQRYYYGLDWLVSLKNLIEVLDNTEVFNDISLETKKRIKKSGNYGHSLGLGWSLNLPYMSNSGGGISVRLPSGSFYSITNMSINEEESGVSTSTSSTGATDLEEDEESPVTKHRKMVFENHEGENFKLIVYQSRRYVSEESDEFFIKGWVIDSSTLVLKDGSTYEFDGNGRYLKGSDPLGENHIYVSYHDDKKLDTITDTMGRVIKFEYEDSNSLFVKPVINKITVDSDSSEKREISYIYSRSKNFKDVLGSVNAPKIPVLSTATDINGREWNYDYGLYSMYSQETSVATDASNLFDGFHYRDYLGSTYDEDNTELHNGININWIVLLTLAEGPGLGKISVDFDQEQLIYKGTYVSKLFGLIPTGVGVSITTKIKPVVRNLTTSLNEVEMNNIHYEYNYIHSGNSTFYSKNSTVNDGKLKTQYGYSIVSKEYYTKFDWEKLTEVVSSLNDGYKNSFKKNNYIPINTSTTYSDSNTSKIFYTIENDYDTNTLDIIETRNIRSSDNYSTKKFTFDNWGNIEKETFEETIKDKVIKSITLNSYLNTESSIDDEAVWDTTKKVDTLALNEAYFTRYSLLNATKTFGSDTDSTSEKYYTYNSLGQLYTSNIKTENGWSKNVHYYTIEDGEGYNRLTGELTKIIKPYNNEISITYDFSPDTYYLMTKTYKDILNIEDNSRSDISNSAAYDKETGYLKWSTDGRGYKTKITYDKLGRKTNVTLPDSDNNPENNPMTTISYDDPTLLVTVTRPNTLISEYQFDNLSRLVTIKKLAIGDDKIDSITSFEYDAWNNISKFTNPNSYISSFTYDPLGQVTSEIYTEDGEELTKNISYDYMNLSKTTTNERGIKIIESFDFKNNLTKTDNLNLYDGIVATTELFYDGLGNVVAVKDAMGNTTTHEYNSRNLLVKTTHPEADYNLNGQEITGQAYNYFEYDNSGNKIVEIIGLGVDEKVRTSHLYDGLNRLIKSSVNYKDVNGDLQTTETKFTFDENSNPKKTIDPRGLSWSKFYTPRNQLDYELDPLNNKTSYTYDISDRLETMTDPRGQGALYSDLDFTIEYDYDNLNRLTTARLPRKHDDTEKPVISFTYDLVGNVKTRTEPDGALTSYYYSHRRRLLSETKAGLSSEPSYTTTYDYDEVGNLISTTLPDKSVPITYAYDDLNRVKSEIYVDGSFLSYGYDHNNNKVWETSTNGFTTLYAYDALNRLTTTTDPEWESREFSYDLLGNITNLIDGNKNVSNYHYNEIGQLLKEINTRGKESTYIYDLGGNLISAVDPNGTTATYTVLNNNLLASINYVNGTNSQNVSYAYDEAGAVKSVTDRGITTNYNLIDSNYRPDPYDNKYRVETEGYSSVNYNYDNQSRLTGMNYDSGLNFTQTYNSLSQLESISGFITSRSYDDNGYLSSVLLNNGVKNSYTYTDKLQLESIAYNFSEEELKRFDYKYDTGGNISAENQNLYGYDSKNQLTTALLTGGVSETTFELMTLETGESKNDVLGEQQFNYHTEILTDENLDIDWGSKSFAIDTVYSYRIKTITLHRDGGVIIDERVSMDKISIYTSNYNRDQAFTEVINYGMENLENGDIKITFTDAVFARYIKVHSHYNELDRAGEPVHIRSLFKLAKLNPVKIEAVTSGRNEFYTIDANGNRVKREIMSKKPVVDNYSLYENSDLIKTDSTTAYIYDDNGNLIEKGNIYNFNEIELTIIPSKGYYKYFYDLKNRLTEVEKYSTLKEEVERVATYIYDANNYRIKKIDKDNLVTKYIFDNNGNCIEEILPNGKVISYIFMNNRHLARVSGNETLYYGVNNVGSTVLLTNQAGEAVWNGDITPFGDKQDGAGEIEESVKYTGKTLDEDTGLYYYNARWYDPNLGRFITEDPIKDGNNWYIYASNNPLRFTDPTGLSSADTFALGAQFYNQAANIYGSDSTPQVPDLEIVAAGAWVVGGFVTGYALIQMGIEKIMEASKDKAEEEAKDIPNLDGSSTSTSAGGDEDPEDDEDRIKAENRKDLKKLAKELSKENSEPLNQDELDSLKDLAKEYDSEVRVDLDGVKGTGTEPHAHVEGMGSKVESRHIWLQDGVK